MLKELIPYSVRISKRSNCFEGFFPWKSRKQILWDPADIRSWLWTKQFNSSRYVMLLVMKYYTPLGPWKIRGVWLVPRIPELIKTVQPHRQQIPRTIHMVVLNKSTVNGICSSSLLSTKTTLHVGRWWLQLKSGKRREKSVCGRRKSDYKACILP